MARWVEAAGAEAAQAQPTSVPNSKLPSVHLLAGLEIEAWVNSRELALGRRWRQPFYLADSAASHMEEHGADGSAPLVRTTHGLGG